MSLDENLEEEIEQLLSEGVPPIETFDEATGTTFEEMESRVIQMMADGRSKEASVMAQTLTKIANSRNARRAERRREAVILRRIQSGQERAVEYVINEFCNMVNTRHAVPMKPDEIVEMVAAHICSDVTNMKEIRHLKLDPEQVMKALRMSEIVSDVSVSFPFINMEEFAVKVDKIVEKLEDMIEVKDDGK